MSQYKLGLVEFYNPQIHGSINTKLHTQFLYSLNIPVDEFINDHPNGWIDDMINRHHNVFNWRSIVVDVSHPIIRNYNSIVHKRGSVMLEIVKPFIIMDEGVETYLCILKTFWLKLFQRKWKQYYRNKILIRKNPKVLLNRQIYGKWN
tara:strand:+ start:507 stop:950 length:444 start_codon:yes stop_codon:yes gene_type:complete